jgi:hypothetical protein
MHSPDERGHNLLMLALMEVAIPASMVLLASMELLTDLRLYFYANRCGKSSCFEIPRDLSPLLSVNKVLEVRLRWWEKATRLSATYPVPRKGIR